jgi:hypothetical protein
VVLAGVLVAGVLVGVIGGPLAAAAPGRPAQSPDRPLTIGAVSPWVESDGTFEVAFRPSTAVPLDSTLSYTIHQRLRPEGDESLRQRTDDVLDGGDLGGILQATVEVPTISYGNPVEGLVLRIPLSGTGGGGRTFVPTPGVHPVELELNAADGSSLWVETVFLNRMPAETVTDPSGGPGRLSVSLVVPIEGPPSLGPDGTPELDAETRAVVASATGLLTQVPDAPLVLGLRPNTLSGVMRSSTGPDGAFVQALRSPSVRATVARRTDVAVDTGGLVAADASDAVIQQLDLGDRVVRSATGRVPATDTWLLDETVSPESLPLVAGVGTRRVVVPTERLRLPSGADAEVARTRALALQGATDLTVLADDPRLTLRLVDPQVDAGLRANQVATALMSSWFTAADEGPGSFPGPSVAIVVPAATDPEVVRALLPAVTGTGPLTADPAAVPLRPARIDGEVVTAALAPRLPSDQRRPAEEARASRALIASFAGMAGDREPDLLLWELLNAETLSTQMDPGSRQEIHRTVEAQIRSRVASIVLPPERRVVLTSRDAAIPLRFRNDLTYPVLVRVTYRSPRLEVEGGGVQTVVLQPGENRIDLNVSVQAPGSAILRVGVTSPDSQIAVGQSSLPVTSSRISGVGAVLSVISILVLAGWWILTVRRSRRERTAGATPASVGARPAGPDRRGGDVAATVGGGDAADHDGGDGSVDRSG